MKKRLFGYLYLMIIFLISCNEKKFEDQIVSYGELPLEVKYKFDKIFSQKVSEKSFIIVECIGINSDCDYELTNTFFLKNSIHLNLGEKQINIPFDLTAVRIFVYTATDEKIYYIKRAAFSKLEGGRLDEFLDYKNQNYNVFKISSD